MNFTFTTEQTIRRTDEIAEYMSEPRLWIPQTDYPDFDKWMQRVHIQLRSETKRAVLALCSGHLAGVIVYQHHKERADTLEIKNVTVRPDVRGRHVASFLLRNAEIEGCHDFHTSSVVTDAKADNLAIRSFLLKGGYLPMTCVDLYGLRSGRDIVYRKHIGP